jgi:hypothetical protein
MKKLQTLSIYRWHIFREDHPPEHGFVFDQLDGTITRGFQRLEGLGFVGGLTQALSIIGCLLASEDAPDGCQIELVRVCSLIECLNIYPLVSNAEFEVGSMPVESAQAKPAVNPDDIPF